MRAIEEHLATRASAGLFDFSFMGLYEFADAAALQPLQTRDLAAVAPGQLVYTLFLNEDGSVFNDATAWRLPGGQWWVFTGRRGDFARWRGAARDRSGEYAILALQGPRSGQLLAGLAGKDFVLSLKYFRFQQQGDLVVARLGYSGELGYELLVPAALEQELRGRILGQGVPECSFEAANSLRIESGYVLFDREIDGRANPRELGLERLVAAPRTFPMARKLVGLLIQEEASKNEPAAEAALTSECFSPNLDRRIGLGFAPPDAQGEVRLADGRSALVSGLPFYDPERRRPRGTPL